jgi:fatty-acid peroxygenase
VRAGRVEPPAESALYRIAWHREIGGELLPARVAAVELLNVLRPTVAVSVYVVFLANALHEHPEWEERLRDGHDDDARCFVEEVRRLYPFFPAVPALVRRDFRWNGFELRRGTRALLDLHGTSRDERTWKEPDAFRPERFRGRVPGPFDSIAQGGADPWTGHRCAGETVAVALMRSALGWLLRDTAYGVPPQDLALDRTRLPALPRSGFVLEGVQPRTTVPPRAADWLARPAGGAEPARLPPRYAS